MPKEFEPVKTGTGGYETHPAFGMCSIHRIHAQPGVTLFQSDLRHREFIQLVITEAERKRDLKQDWVHPGRVIAKVDMSLAQFASLVTSAGTEGVPVTISYTAGGARPGRFPDSRLQQTATEVATAAEDAYAVIKERLAAYEQALENKAGAAERRALLQDLHMATANAAPNVNYAAARLAEHAEDVVEKSRADVEAMVRMAQERGEKFSLTEPEEAPGELEPAGEPPFNSAHYYTHTPNDPRPDCSWCCYLNWYEG